MEHTEPWQVFAENGLPTNRGATREEFAINPSFLMGASHVWVWRQGAQGVEILLQKRAKTKKTWPGFYDVSAAGHIDFGESSVVAAVREMKEEINLEVPPDRLKYIFSLRTPLDIQEIDDVFLCEAHGEFMPKFNDGEVDEVKWVALETFIEYTGAPMSYNLLDQGEEYFKLLTANLVKL